MPPRTTLSRRSAVVAVCAVPATLLLTGCTADESATPGPRSRRSSQGTDPDVTIAAELLAALRRALTLTEATAQRHPDLAGRLADVVDAHRRHVAVLDDAVPPAGAATSPDPSDAASAPGGDASPGSSAPAQTTPRVPRDARRALSQVAAEERQLAAQAKQLAFRSRSGPFARLLGGIAASAAQHAAVLGGPPAEPVS